MQGDVNLVHLVVVLAAYVGNYKPVVFVAVAGGYIDILAAEPRSTAPVRATHTPDVVERFLGGVVRAVDDPGAVLSIDESEMIDVILDIFTANVEIGLRGGAICDTVLEVHEAHDVAASPSSERVVPELEAHGSLMRRRQEMKKVVRASSSSAKSASRSCFRSGFPMRFHSTLEMEARSGGVPYLMWTSCVSP